MSSPFIDVSDRDKALEAVSTLQRRLAFFVEIASFGGRVDIDTSAGSTCDMERVQLSMYKTTGPTREFFVNAATVDEAIDKAIQAQKIISGHKQALKELRICS